MTLDTQLFYFFNSLAGQSRFLDGAIVFCASYLAYILIAAFLVLVFFSRYQKREKVEILLVAGISSVVARFGVTDLIRFFYHHPRPFLALPNVQPLLTENSWSFPSGHAAFFFALATAVYLYNKKWGIGFFIATILMTISRVIAGVHYPSDIVGGAAIGVTIACIVYSVAYRMEGKRLHETY